MKKNNYIQNKSLKTFFIASLLISAITQINTLTDGIIVGHFVSPDALSIINLAAPILSVVYMLASMVSMGVSILVTKEIGMQNYLKVSQLFTASMLMSVASTGLLSAGMYLYSDNLAALLTDEMRLLPLLKGYLPVTFIGSMVIAIQVILMMFVKLSGRPEIVTKAVLVECASNIFLDLLLVGYFSMGISGAAWATILSILCSLLYLVPFVGKDSMLKWVHLQQSWLFPDARSTVVNGIPAAVGSIAMAVLTIALNALVLNTQGADGMFIFSVSLQMLMVSMLVLGGAGSAITGIGGVLLGEGDIDGYRSLVVGILKKCAFVLAVFTLFMVIYPDGLARLFGATDELLQAARQPLRVFCVSFLPLGIITILDSSFLLQGHRSLSSFIQTLYVVCLVPAVWLASVYLPEYFWYSIPVGVLMMFIILICSTLVISRKDKTLHWFTLISKLPNDPSIDMSVDYNLESVQEAIEKIHSFLDICELDKEMYYKIDSCLEELTHNLISMTQDTGKQGSFDLRVVDDGKKILVIMKDDGKPYNPILKYKETEGSNAEEANLALVILNGLCPDLNYKYMNGINCLYMNFKYAE